MTRSLPRVVGAVLLGLVLAVALRLAFPERGAPTPTGEFQLQALDAATPPSWRLERLGGGHLRSSDLGGTVALLYFWTTW